MPTRRTILSTLAALPAFPAIAGGLAQPLRDTRQPQRADDDPGARHRGPVAIASGNGLECVKRAYELITNNTDPAEAAVQGVAINEADPDDMSVGFGGLPNELGVVSLDACVMHGPSHKAGAVAAIENIMHPAQVALIVLKNTDHVLIVGEHAKRFAIQHGFKEEDLLTDRARQAWLKWKRNLNQNDDWLNDDQQISQNMPSNNPSRGRKPADTPEDQLASSELTYDANGVPHTTGTIHCSVRTPTSDLAGCTTTSGLSYKIPGRVGDSPLIGAGNYTDNNVGSAGATGRGEAAIQSLAAYTVVREMESGMSPTEACLETLRRVARNTKRQDLLNDQNRPNFGLTLYAINKDGNYGSATMRGRRQYAIATNAGARLERSASLYT